LPFFIQSPEAITRSASGLFLFKTVTQESLPKMEKKYERRPRASCHSPTFTRLPGHDKK
jgi:hypothetical protein